MTPAPPDQAPAGGSRRAPGRPRVLLTSRSPRRRQLLAQHDVEFLADHPGVEDSDLRPGRATPEQWVAALSYLKARAGLDTFASRLRRGDVLLGADTACVLDGVLYGTPTDAAEARAIILAFCGRTHDVVTGLTIFDPFTGERRLLVDRAAVSLGALGDAQVEEYIAGGGWAGKAGAYNLEERVAAGWPIEVSGDPTTVVGLPMKLLLRALDRRRRDAQTLS